MSSLSTLYKPGAKRCQPAAAGRRPKSESNKLLSDVLRITQHLSKIRNKLKRLYIIAVQPQLTLEKENNKNLNGSHIFIYFFSTMRRRPVNPEIY